MKVQPYHGSMSRFHDSINFSGMLFNPEMCRRLTFLETEEGDGTEAKRSRSFSRVLLVLLLATEQATGASRKKNRITYSTDMKTCPLYETRPQAHLVLAQGAWIGCFKRSLTLHSHKGSGVGYSCCQRAAETQA